MLISWFYDVPWSTLLLTLFPRNRNGCWSSPKMIEQAFISVVKTMSWLPPSFLGMVSVSTTYLYKKWWWLGDGANGIVSTTLFQIQTWLTLAFWGDSTWINGGTTTHTQRRCSQRLPRSTATTPAASEAPHGPWSNGTSAVETMAWELWMKMRSFIGLILHEKNGDCPYFSIYLGKKVMVNSD